MQSRIDQLLIAMMEHEKKDVKHILYLPAGGKRLFRAMFAWE